MTIISQHHVVTTALASLFNTNDVTNVNDDKISKGELDRRKFLSVQLVRYATQQVAKINTLSNMLMSLVIMDLVQNGRSVPIRLSDTNHTLWNWCMIICTTFHGEWVTLSIDKKENPKPRAKRTKGESTKSASLQAKEKRKHDVDDDAKEEKKSKSKRRKKNQSSNNNDDERQRRAAQNALMKVTIANETTPIEQQGRYRHMKRIFETQLKPLFPADFEWPDREGLEHILIRERQKRMVNFKTSYGETFLSRQSKVVRHQINELATFKSIKAKNNTSRKYLRHLCTRYVVASINRWTPIANFDTLWIKHTKRQQDSSLLLADLDDIVQDHQQSFGLSPLSDECYRLGDSDAGIYPSCYVHYFYYLWQEYLRFGTLARQDAASCKWKSFSIIPQISQQIPFIDLDARGITGLMELSNNKRVQKYVLSIVQKERRGDVLLANAVKETPNINWLVCRKEELDTIKYIKNAKAAKAREQRAREAGKEIKPRNVKTKDKRTDNKDKLVPIVADWATQNQEKVFDLLFSCFKEENGYHSILRISNKSKYRSRHFESLISTDGQQAKIHHSTMLKTPLPSTDDAQGEIPKDEFAQWIREGKTIVSIDPGHRDLITAVRHHLEKENHQNLDEVPPPTSRKGKQKLARAKRQQEARQSVYQLSNKSYYERAGFTSAARTRDAWRKKSGLKDLDVLLSTDWEKCCQRTWDPIVYQSYVGIISAHWDMIWNELSQHKYQKLRFQTFQRQQKIYPIIAQELCGLGRKPSDCVLLWGNGSFGPTSRGHAAAPNKKLRKKLMELGFIIRLVDEYNTSKTAACCFSKSEYSIQRQTPARIIGPLPRPERKKLRGLLYCSRCTHNCPSSYNLCHHHDHGVVMPLCGDKVADICKMMPIKSKSTPWNRDVCSAINIFYRAYYGSRGVVPLCFLRPTRADEVVGGTA